ncbi:MAG: hypothetical protein PQJ50_10905 [Spirochaetales bacterium]|nr:hypothetical protein [Spirochaetales bacterium]
MKDPPVVRLDLLEEERGSSESPLRSLICRYHWHFDSKLSTEFLKTYGALSDFDSPLKRKKDLHKAIARLKRDLEVLRELGVSSFEDPGSADSEIIRQWYL